MNNSDHEVDLVAPSTTTRQIKATATMERAPEARVETRIWSKKLMKTWDNHPRSKASRQAWKDKNAKVYENVTNNEDAPRMKATALLAGNASVSGSTQLEDGDSAPTTIVATSSANAATPTPENANASTSIPTASNYPQTKQPTWRIIRFGPPPPPVQLQSIPDPVVEDAATPSSENAATPIPENINASLSTFTTSNHSQAGQSTSRIRPGTPPPPAQLQTIPAPAVKDSEKISVELKPGKENKPDRSVSAAAPRRSTRIVKKRAAKPTRNRAHPQVGSSDSGAGVDSTSPA